MLHMMVDIESLDTAPSTVICSLGAVVFDDQRMDIITKRTWNCNWQSQLAAGRTASESTLRWWLEQEENARKQLLRRGQELTQVLFELRSFWNMNKPERIWANGMDFDIAALAHAYRQSEPSRLGDAIPWGYNAARDLRLFRDIVPQDVFDDVAKPAVVHDALQDAEFQSRYVMVALQWLRQRATGVVSDEFIPTHRHYKGGDYQWLGTAQHTERDDEELVIYRSDTGRWWARPTTMFEGRLEDGTRRFDPINKD
jgi:hypothetical protein